MSKSAKSRKQIAEKDVISAEEQHRHGRIVFYLLLVLIACLAAGGDFLDQRQRDVIHPSFALTKTRRLSHYLSSLRDSRGDTDLYIFQGRKPGGTLLIIGGTHPNEPASNVTAALLVENLRVEQGQVIVIPRANESGFSATEPQEAFPQHFALLNRLGKEREFRVGSRYANILDGWPDPVVYRHYPSGQLLSGPETRNLNRAYPGRRNGTLTERVAFAITEIVRREKVDLVIDLHEAAPEYPVINAIVAHDRAMDIAAMAAVELQTRGFDFRLEPSPVNFHGLSHREIGDKTGARAILMESAGALQGRLRGPTNEDLVIKSVDQCYHKASQLGKLAVDFPAEGIPLEVRVGRHLTGIKVICDILGRFEPEKSIVYNQIPDYDELNSHGVGFYLK